MKAIPRTKTSAVVLTIAFVTGAILFAVFIGPASAPKNLVKFTFGDRSVLPGDLSSALHADYGLILGYGLVLGACACTISILAVSETGQWVGKFLLPVVFLAMAADVIENVVLELTWNVDVTSHWVTVTAALATVKWSAFVAACFGIFVAAMVVAQWTFSVWQARRKKVGEKKDREWWEDAIPEVDVPATNWSSSPASDIGDEQQWAWRKAYGVPGVQAVNDRVVSAVCLSGGGVRSACVAMGALQVFAKEAWREPALSQKDEKCRRGGEREQLVDELDYVLSVSGGGYTAGSRVLAVQPDDTEQSELLISQRFSEGSVEFDHFRRHSSYIADSVRSLVQALGIVLKNLLASMVIFFWTPAAIGFVAGYFLAAVPLAPFAPVDIEGVVHNRGAWLAVASAVLLTIATIAIALVFESIRTSENEERRRLLILRISRRCTAFALLIALGSVVIPAVILACSSVKISQTASTVGGVVGLQYIVTVAAMIWAKKDRIPIQLVANPSWRDKLPQGVVQLLFVMVTLAVLLVMWLVVFGSVAAGVFKDRVQDAGSGQGGLQSNWLLLVGVAIVVGLVLVLSFADVTSLSLHPFYRWRLARTFAVRAKLENNIWSARPYKYEEATWLHKYGKVPGKGPEFIFCAAAAVSGDAKPAPGLNAVSFVLGTNHIGGPSLGWLNTREICDASSPRIQRDLTVQAAVAVSGAAFASAMGRANKGFQTLLAVSGARLGTWLPNPAFVANLRRRTEQDQDEARPEDQREANKPMLRSLPFVRGFTYFYRELLGINSGTGRLVQVTDGGHYENLGLVEALRRRCRLIYCIDGGGDTPPLLEGLSDAIRLAKSELGIEIDLDKTGSFAVQNLAPGSGEQFPEDHAFFNLNKRLTAGTATRAKILYPPAAGFADEETSEGCLIFAKAVLTTECPHWLLTYAAAHDVFPHDSTSDQWFNEGQFAAYTEIGRIMAKDAIKAVTAPPLKVVNKG